MTMTTRFPLVCECGHEGSIKLRENDAPFSGPWESWSLEGFTGRVPKDDDEGNQPLPGVTCPACGQTGRVRHKTSR